MIFRLVVFIFIVSLVSCSSYQVDNTQSNDEIRYQESATIR